MSKAHKTVVRSFIEKVWHRWAGSLSPDPKVTVQLKGHVTFVGMIHEVAGHFERYRPILNKLRQQAEADRRGFVVISDYGGDAELTLDLQKAIRDARKSSRDVAQALRETWDSLESVRQLFDERKRTAQQKYRDLQEGRLAETAVYTFMDAFDRWIGETRTSVVLEDLQCDHWIDSQLSAVIEEDVWAVVNRSGLRTETDREEYFQCMDTYVEALARAVQYRNQQIANQILVEVHEGRSVAAFFGVAHRGVATHLENAQMPVIIAGSLDESEWTPVIRLVVRLHNGDKLDAGWRQQYLRRIVWAWLYLWTRRLGYRSYSLTLPRVKSDIQTDYASYLKRISHIADRWREDDIFALAQAIQEGKDEDYFLKWLQMDRIGQQFFGPLRY